LAFMPLWWNSQRIPSRSSFVYTPDSLPGRQVRAFVRGPEYLAFCLEGKGSIPQRKEMLNRKAAELEEQIRIAHESLDYIAWKQQLYDDFLSGKVPFKSNLTQD
jgi:hypothetical protein